jgi:C1A family cysteine protease
MRDQLRRHVQATDLSSSVTRRTFMAGAAAVICSSGSLGPITTGAIAQGTARVFRHARGARPPQGLEKRIAEMFKSAAPKIAPPAALPPKFDWRETGFVTPVKDQGLTCGTCWLFAAIGAYESAYKKASKKVDSYLELSEQEILDCSFAETNCVVGGWHEVVFAYLLTEGAIGAYDSNGVPVYTYDSNNPQRGTFCNSNFGTRQYYARDWGYVLADAVIPPSGELKQAINTNGPVVCGVTAGNDWDDYRGGVVKATPFDPASFNARDINHEVLIVGWDDTVHAPGFPTPGVWLVKNSWGDAWGDKGYIRVPYGGDNIGYGASWISAWA